MMIEDDYMGRSPLVMLAYVSFVVTACTSDPSLSGGPRLVQDVTLEPTAVLPTRIPSVTPVVIPVATSESVSPLEVATVEGRFPEFVLITPTLPPSKTPTLTPTISPTPTRTPVATNTVLPPLFPTFVLATLDVSSPAINPALSNQSCSTAWFFSLTATNRGCPMGAPLSTSAAYQQFQQGFMIWVQQQDAIYVFYDSVGMPRWEVFRDDYEDTLPEWDPSLWVNQPPYTWQPRRGFGLIWRNNPTLQSRIGWAVREWEEPYDTQVQIAADGTIFLAEPHGGIIGLQPGGRDWDRYITP
jgi:hypothetical protein